MGKIYCVMGKSSSGKDTIYKKLLSREELHLRQIIPYTTRPIREGEQDGVEYHFCTREEKDRLLAEDKIIELRSYNTVHGIWDYFTADDGQIDLAREDCILIGTLETYSKLLSHFGKKCLVPIYIEVEDGVRLMRALEREMQEASPKYEEMCRRFLADQADFSEENLRRLEIDHAFQNDEIEMTVDEIASYIEAVRNSI